MPLGAVRFISIKMKSELSLGNLSGGAEIKEEESVRLVLPSRCGVPRVTLDEV